MLELSRHSDAGLMDLLISFTNAYSKLLANRDFKTHEYGKCKEMIKRIQDEIQYRRKASGIY